MTAAPPGLAPPQDCRFASFAVSIDVRQRARRAAAWLFAGALLTMTPLAFLVSGYLFLVAVAAGVLLLGAAVAPRLRVLGPGPGAIEIRAARSRSR